MWIHPVDRDDAPEEIRLLGRAWMALMQSGGGYCSPDSDAPQWAKDVFAAFAAANPGFEPAGCMTPQWRAEKRAAFDAAPSIVDEMNASAEAEKARRDAEFAAAQTARKPHASTASVEVTGKIVYLGSGFYGIRVDRKIAPSKQIVLPIGDAEKGRTVTVRVTKTNTEIVAWS